MPAFKLAICAGSRRHGPLRGMESSRRRMLAGSAATLGLLPFLVGGCREWLTPGEARRRAIALTTLTEGEARLLEAFGEVLLPGATAAGIAHFVDHHLGVPAADSLLTIRYLDVPPPWADVYRAGLAALARLAEARHGSAFESLRAAQADSLVGEIIKAQPDGWQGPPAPMFTFVVRSDAVDVVYGTREGMARLGLPVMAHLDPEREW